MGERAQQVHWIVGDVLDFHPKEKYDLWHDRAAFHFQTTPEAVNAYLHIAEEAISGKLIVATFSPEGPKKCSGLEIKQYDENGISHLFEQAHFKKLDCKREDHLTPSGGVQNFVFCSFEKESKTA